jgi:hypothetical protein
LFDLRFRATIIPESFLGIDLPKNILQTDPKRLIDLAQVCKRMAQNLTTQIATYTIQNNFRRLIVLGQDRRTDGLIQQKFIKEKQALLDSYFRKLKICEVFKLIIVQQVPLQTLQAIPQLPKRFFALD